MDKPVVALFDFDGTLTRSDTLPLFIRHSIGWVGLTFSILSVLPAMVVLACARWRSVWGIDAGTTKEHLLRRCFVARTIDEMARQGETFSHTIDAVVAPAVVERMQWHLAQGHTVVIVTASVDVWVEPWARKQGVHEVIATRFSICNGVYTGHFDGLNCNGEEKARRIASRYPNSQYHLIAYGNSSGDYPMFHYAHEAFLCNDGAITPFPK